MIKIYQEDENGVCRMVPAPTAHKLDGTPFAIYPYEAGGREAWMLIHVPSGHALARAGWLQSFGATYAVYRWWGELDANMRALFGVRDIKMLSAECTAELDQLLESAQLLLHQP